MKHSILNRFLQAHEVQAFKIARAAVGSHDDALDIVQDTMLSLCKNYSAKPESELAPLFFRMLNNRIMDHFRQVKSRSQWLQEADPARPEPDAQDGSAAEGLRALLSERQLAAVSEALAQLPARQQEAFLWRSWEGQSTAQTAAHMGCTEGSVKTHYSRALTSMRQALSGLWP
ncbi:sigma-70 family RNA polymerase sigma factor [Simiduia sp. 21SJ11W-1]|uniref:sigma-70 family RNA polymerase sigma factor n=1 Tax=Simiduia sp. 21SJ11W-1 TaxID=2909669 RepID=UPI00209F59CA|nr:sigma-70 family RNA polymerase sigma factor [Simiduia sp. 21SJ11W-1]UTA49568.1 sigma-70 family RNA polymerase sigma factor [Simiduia sp. 21SJ11W-1]